MTHPPLGRFGDLAGLETLDADGDPFRRPIYKRPDGLQVWQESAGIDTGYLLADAAFFLGKAPAYDRSTRNRFFTANLAYLGHVISLSF